MDEEQVEQVMKVAARQAKMAVLLCLFVLGITILDMRIKSGILKARDDAQGILRQFVKIAREEHYGAEAASQAGDAEAGSGGGDGAGGADAGGGGGAVLPADDATGTVLAAPGSDQLPAKNGVKGRAGGVASGPRGHGRGVAGSAS